MRTFLLTASWLSLALLSGAAFSADANRLTYLDEFCDPYYVGRDFPKLTTPQWIGEEGVQAVVVLAIDDMRDTAKYETYLRPILQRLKQIEGQAPVSIMTCRVDPADPQLKAWIDEGLSIEVHTVDHPCPLLQGGDFAKARSTYDRCVDLMNDIPGNTPVAFRMPCCDSLNTPSPRFWTEILNKTTERGNYLQIDTSVFNITTSNDTDLPRSLTVDEDGRERFRKYLPFPSFVNTIEDYPYPYVIGRLCWEFPCAVPSDWEAQDLQQPNNPKTVEDLKAALDAVVLKQGTFNLVFHPHGWIRNDQVVELIDHAFAKHGHKVKFLTFGQALERMNKNLLADEPLRDSLGRDNGVRLIDLNNDGYLDVQIGNRRKSLTRIWNPNAGWQETEHRLRMVGPQVELADSTDADKRVGAHNFAYGVLRPQGFAVHLEHELSMFALGNWQPVPEFSGLLAQVTGVANHADGGNMIKGGNRSLRMRDVDHDGICEILVSNSSTNQLFHWHPDQQRWKLLPFGLPPETMVIDHSGNDAGLRFVDINEDGFDDVVFSNGERYSLHLFESIEKGWTTKVIQGRRGAGGGTSPTIPMIVRPDGTNNGAWFHSRTMWVQNEDTSRLPDGVDRLSFDQMLGKR